MSAAILHVTHSSHSSVSLSSSTRAIFPREKARLTAQHPKDLISGSKSKHSASSAGPSILERNKRHSRRQPSPSTHESTPPLLTYTPSFRPNTPTLLQHNHGWWTSRLWFWLCIGIQYWRRMPISSTTKCESMLPTQLHRRTLPSDASQQTDNARVEKF